jgi:hypothetical protein
MTSTSTLPAPSPVALPDLTHLGAAPLIPGDDAAAYETLLARLAADVRPGTVIEEAWTRDAADLVWEALRLRRLKAALMTACADQGMRKLLEGLDVRTPIGLARRWAARELVAVGEVEAVLAAAGLGITHVMACTLAVRISEIERIDRMAASAEARRAAALREIGHHREHAPFAARLRDAAAAQIADAEFTEIAAPARPAAATTT